MQLLSLTASEPYHLQPLPPPASTTSNPTPPPCSTGSTFPALLPNHVIHKGGARHYRPRLILIARHSSVDPASPQIDNGATWTGQADPGPSQIDRCKGRCKADTKQ